MTIYYEAKEDNKEPVDTIFEYNCLALDGSPSGCPVCSECKQPAYEETHCVFCGIGFKKRKCK